METVVAVMAGTSCEEQHVTDTGNYNNNTQAQQTCTVQADYGVVSLHQHHLTIPSSSSYICRDGCVRHSHLHCGSCSCTLSYCHSLL